MKKNSLWIGVVVLAFACGMGTMYLYNNRPSADEIRPEDLESASILTVDLDNASLPADVTEAKEKPAYADASKVPSQLSEMDLSGITGFSRPTDEEPQESLPPAPRVLEPVVIKTDSATVTPHEVLPSVATETEDSKITLIQVPVTHLIVRTPEEYKQFKRKARGKYPDVNFNKQMVVALESASDMPDKMFEIVRVNPTEEAVEVEYRVNIFGLEQKTTTHTTAVLNKTEKPVVLKQVL